MSMDSSTTENASHTNMSWHSRELTSSVKFIVHHRIGFQILVTGDFFFYIVKSKDNHVTGCAW